MHCSEDPLEVLRLIYTHCWVDLFQPTGHKRSLDSVYPPCTLPTQWLHSWMIQSGREQSVSPADVFSGCPWQSMLVPEACIIHVNSAHGADKGP